MTSWSDAVDRVQRAAAMRHSLRARPIMTTADSLAYSDAVSAMLAALRGLEALDARRADRHHRARVVTAQRRAERRRGSQT